jgi:hypothetical protein
MHNSLSICRPHSTDVPVVACWTSAGQLEWRWLVLFWFASHRLADRRERDVRKAAAGYSQRGKDTLGKLRIKQPTRCIQYPKFYFVLNSTCFRHLLCPSSGVIYCTHGNWYVLCRLCDGFLAESGWNCVNIKQITDLEQFHIWVCALLVISAA